MACFGHTHIPNVFCRFYVPGFAAAGVQGSTAHPTFSKIPSPSTNATEFLSPPMGILKEIPQMSSYHSFHGACCTRQRRWWDGGQYYSAWQQEDHVAFSGLATSATYHLLAWKTAVTCSHSRTRWWQDPPTETGTALGSYHSSRHKIQWVWIRCLYSIPFNCYHAPYLAKKIFHLLCNLPGHTLTVEYTTLGDTTFCHLSVLLFHALRYFHQPQSVTDTTSPH